MTEPIGDTLEDGDEEWGYGDDAPEHANLAAAIDVLRPEAQGIPDWLRHAGELDAATLTDFLASRVVYYPGAGTDGQAFKIFGGSRAAGCFVHADYLVTARAVSDELGPGGHPLAGYTIVFQEFLQPQVLQHMLGFDYERQFNLPPRFDDGQPKPALWAILKRDDNLGDDHGPERIAFLHMCAEAVWVYWNLWSRFKKGGPYAMVLQDHGFGCNWTRFGDRQEPLFQEAAQSGLPGWLLVGENTEPWPGYVAASDWTAPAAFQPHPRRLWKRLPRNNAT